MLHSLARSSREVGVESGATAPKGNHAAFGDRHVADVADVPHLSLFPPSLPFPFFFANIGDVVCVGDINRMTSQKKRGDGTICLHNIDLWKSMRALVASTDACVSLP